MYEEHPLWRCERQWHHMTYTTAGVLVLLCSDHKRDENNSVLFLHLGTGSQDRNPGCGVGWGLGRIERASCFTCGPDQLRREGTLEGTQKGNQYKDKEQEPTVTSTGSASPGARSLKGSRGSTRRTPKQATPGFSLLSSVSSPSRISDKRLPQQRKQYHHDWRWLCPCEDESVAGKCHRVILAERHLRAGPPRNLLSVLVGIMASRPKRPCKPAEQPPRGNVREMDIIRDTYHAMQTLK